MAERRGELAIGVIGAGAIGRLHAENLALRVPGARLAAIADVDRAAAEACAAECGVQAVYQDYRRLLAQPGLQAVAVCSPSDTHPQVIEEAAALGKHIFCEKPLGCDLGSIDRALAAVAKAGVKLQVGFNRRFDANFRQVRQAVAAGKIGRPYILHITSRDPLLPPPQGPAPYPRLLLETTIHDLDMARFLLGSEVSSVYAMAAPLVHETADVDTAVLALRFEGGAMGTIDNGQAVYGYDQRVEVFGSAGAIETGNEREHQAILSDKDGVHAALPLHFFRERYAASYVAEMSAFVDCVLRDKTPPVTGADGRIAVVLALAAVRSLREARPVAVSEIQGA